MQCPENTAMIYYSKIRYIYNSRSISDFEQDR
jgi:hypothetical protein